jgi:hypothetical protein
MSTPFGNVADVIVETMDGPRSAAISYADFDTPQLAAVNLDKVVDAGRDAIATGWRGQVTADVRTEPRAGVFTRDITITIPNRRTQGPVYFRWIGFGRRLYTLAILADRDSVPIADRDRFFSSFQVLK